MKTLTYDKNIGLVVNSNGNLTLDDELTALISLIDQALTFYLGEWFLNTTVGLPYLQQIFEKPLNASLVGSILANRILNFEEVQKIENAQLEYTIETRQLDYTATITTIYGQSMITTTTGV